MIMIIIIIIMIPLINDNSDVLIQVWQEHSFIPNNVWFRNKEYNLY